MIVLDASVLVKLFNEEDDSPIARLAIRAWVGNRRAIGAPTLALYEVLGVALHYEVPFEIPLELFSDLAAAGFTLTAPSAPELLRAHTIATTRRESAGRYPQLEDAIYHAMAIERGGTFITADRKHFDKAVSFGHISMLTDWQSA